MELWIKINWLGVIFSTVFFSFFCGMWHRQFAFGKKWEQAMGFTRPLGWKDPVLYYVVPLIASLVISIVLAFLQQVTHIIDIYGAITIGVVVGVGIAMPVIFITACIPTIKKPLVFGLITGSAQAIGVILASCILFAWSK